MDPREFYHGGTQKQAAKDRIESSHHSTGHHGFVHNGNVGMGKALPMAHHSTGHIGFMDNEEAGSDEEVKDDTK